ncbi:MAG: segregation/condensation protein A [Bacteroidota bacterium]
MYRVRLDQFEGPLDLLLFFIRRDELDVFDIPIARITDEYLAYVTVLEQVDLDAAADFIYMASLLISIKAKMLLPRPDLDEHGQEIDPRQELVERLLDYMRYKEAALHLGRLEEERRLQYVRVAAERERFDSEEVRYRVSLFDLVRALKSALEETPEPTRHDVERYDYAVEDLRTLLIAAVAARPASFRMLARRGPGDAVPTSKAFVIVLFLALLDLVQRQRVRVVTGIDPEDFQVEVVPAGEPGSPLPARTIEPT